MFMFRLKKLNVVKVVATKHARDRLISQGFVEVKEEKEVKKEEKKEEKPKKKVAK